MWPAEFLNFVLNKRSREPTKNFLDKNVGVRNLEDDDRKKVMFFGAHILKTANEVKAKVTGLLNPLYIPTEDLKSGETPTAMLAAIRKAAYSPEALHKAKEAVPAKLKRLQKA